MLPKIIVKHLICLSELKHNLVGNS